MFYFNELWVRFFFSLFYFFFLLALCFFYKHLFFYFFSLPIITTTKHLIYTNPIEFITSYFFMILFICFCFYMFYLFWQILDFLKSALYVYEYKLYFKTFYKNIIVLFGFNVLVIYTFLPYTWHSFECFNVYLTKVNTLNFFLELKVLEYLNFLQCHLITLNTIYLLLFVLSFFKIKTFIFLKKVYCLFNILFSTLFSTMDLYSQFLFLVLLQLFFELYLFLNILVYKFNKNIKIFSVKL